MPRKKQRERRLEVGLGKGFEGLLMLSLMLILWTFILCVKHFKEKGHCDDPLFLITKPSAPLLS